MSKNVIIINMERIKSYKKELISNREIEVGRI